MIEQPGQLAPIRPANEALASSSAQVGRAENDEKDARERLDRWIGKLERQSERLMALVDAAIDGTLEEDESKPLLDPFQASQILSKHLTQLGRFLAQRQQYATGGSSDTERLLLEAILGAPYVETDISTTTEQDETA